MMWSSFKVGPVRIRKSSRGWSWSTRIGRWISFGGKLNGGKGKSRNA